MVPVLDDPVFALALIVKVALLVPLSGATVSHVVSLLYASQKIFEVTDLVVLETDDVGFHGDSSIEKIVPHFAWCMLILRVVLPAVTSTYPDLSTAFSFVATLSVIDFGFVVFVVTVSHDIFLPAGYEPLLAVKLSWFEVTEIVVLSVIHPGSQE